MGDQAKEQRPTKIKVGARVYRIDWSAEGWIKALEDGAAEGRTVWARTNHPDLLINVRNDLADYNQRCSLLHEILHCIYAISGADVRNAVGLQDPEFDIEEYTICRLEEPLMAAMIDNPEVFAYLVGQPR